MHTHKKIYLNCGNNGCQVPTTAVLVKILPRASPWNWEDAELEDKITFDYCKSWLGPWETDRGMREYERRFTRLHLGHEPVCYNRSLQLTMLFDGADNRRNEELCPAERSVAYETCHSQTPSADDPRSLRSAVREPRLSEHNTSRRTIA